MKTLCKLDHILGARDLLIKTQQIIYENQCATNQTESQLTEYTLKKIEAYGFEYFLFRLIPRFGNILTHSKLLTNYPKGFIEHYEKNHYVQTNPIVIHCQLSISPIIWDQTVFSETPEIWEGTQAHGLNHGWSQSVHDTKGVVSILSLARSNGPLTEREFSEKAANVLWLCNQLHTSMTSRYFPRHVESAPTTRLSAREAEVLKWTAEGKTAFDIGMILSLTTRTVNFHISSAIRKMGANNKTSAVVIATKSGLL